MHTLHVVVSSEGSVNEFSKQNTQTETAIVCQKSNFFSRWEIRHQV